MSTSTPSSGFWIRTSEHEGRARSRASTIKGVATGFYIDVDSDDSFMDLEPPRYAEPTAEQFEDGTLEPLPIPTLPRLTDH
jgi:hypothetical protein